MGDPVDKDPDMLFNGPGEMRAFCRTFDWSQTVLGASSHWPQSLRTTVRVIMASPFPVVVLWGQELTQIYNDGYRNLMGNKHPAGLGQATRQCWPEVWHINEPIYQRVWAGESFRFEDALYPVNRSGQLLDARFTLAYGPAFDDSGEIGGVSVTVIETTTQVQEQKQGMQALADSEQRFGLLVGATSEIVYTMSSDWQQMVQLVGKDYLKGTVSANGNWLEEYIPVIEHNRVWNLIQQAIDRQTPFETEHQVFRRDGSVGWVFSRAIPILNETGMIQQWLGAASDITDRKAAEAGQAFLLRFSDALRPLNTPAGIKEIAMTLLAEYMGVNGASYTEVQHDGNSPSAGAGNGIEMPPAVDTVDTSEWNSQLLASYKAGESIVICDIASDQEQSEASKALFMTLQCRAGIGLPLLKNNVLVAILTVQQLTPRLWNKSEISLLQEVGERTWAAVERVRADSALARSEERYRTLFNSIDEGFCLLEPIQAEPVDFRYLEANPAFSQHTGIVSVIGKTIREAFPDAPEEGYAIYDKVWKTGEPVRVVFEVPTIDRFIEVFAFRVMEGLEKRIAVIFKNVTENKRHEADLAFLAEISHDLVGLADIDITMETLALKIAAHFKVSRVAFSEILEGQQYINVTHDWHRTDLSEMRGLYPGSYFLTADFQQAGSAGQVQVIDDTATDARSPVEMTASFQIASLVIVSSRRQERGHFCLTIMDDMPRHWREHEITFIRELAERIWTRLDRAGAEENLRQAEKHLRLATEAAEMATWEWHLSTNQIVWNEEHFRIFGLEPHPGPVSPELFFEHVHPNDRHRVSSQLQQALEKDELFNTEFRAVLENGSTRWMSGYGRVMEKVDDQPALMSGIMYDITARRQAEEALGESEERFRAFVTSTSDAVYQMSADWQQMHQLVGKSFLLDTATKNTSWFEEYIPPEDQSFVRKAINEAIASKAPFELEHRVILAGGRLGWTFSRAIPKFDSQGEIAGWFGTASDITGFKEVQQAQQQSEQQYKILFDSIDEGFCIVEVLFDQDQKAVDYRFLQANPAFMRQTGLVGAVGKTMRELASDHEEFWFEIYGRISKSDKPVRFEHEATALGHFYDVYAFRIGAVGQNRVAILFNDIVERKKAEESLRASQVRLAAIFKSLPVAVGEFDPQGKIVIANKVMDRYMPTGIMPSQDEFRRDRWLAYNPDGSRIEPRDYPGARAMRGERVLPPIEMRYTQDDGNSIWTHVAAVPLKNGEGEVTGQVIIITDIDNLKLAENALQEADRRKDEFLAMLAHELRNPMSTIRNGLTVLGLTSSGSDPVMDQTVALMDRQVDHLIRLVDDLLDVSRITQNKIELKKEPMELGTLLSDAVSAMNGQYLAAGKQLHLNPSATPLYVQGDATRLSQVVTNLLTNGLRYTGDDGEVRVSLSQRAGNALIRVADNGIGLTTDQLGSIFGLFVQGDNSLARSQGGLGIGLTLVQRLVKMHGGHVEAHSRGLGQGSELLVYLPLLNKPASEQGSGNIDAASEGQGRRVLVIDDNADAILLVSMLLRLKGFEVESRKSGLEGIKAAEIFAPAVILCDIGMPDLNGYETAKLIRQLAWGKTIPLIALTGYGQEEDKQLAIQAGFNNHLVKPVDLKELVHLLDKLISKNG